MEQDHIIHKVTIEVSVNNKEKAYEIKNNISSFLNMDVFPKLETYFTTIQAVIPGQTLHISKLTLNINESQDSLNTVLKNTIIKSFEKELAKKIKPALHQGNDSKKDINVNLLGEEERLLNTFIHFLEKGYMPWWSSNENPAIIFEPAVFKKIVSAKAFAVRVAYSMQSQKIMERIINQLTDAQITQICLTITKAKGLKTVLKSTTVSPLIKQFTTDRKSLWLLILNVVSLSFANPDSNFEEYVTEQAINIIPLLHKAKNKGTKEQVWEKITAIFPFIKQNKNFTILKSKKGNVDADNEGRKDTEVKKTGKHKQYIEEISLKKSKEAHNLKTAKAGINVPENKTIDNTSGKIGDETNSYHVQNAGLVLIHPFISNLFKHCNLMDPVTKKLTDPEVCVHLLHYIATGKTNQPESGMLFEKFLCNIPLQQSISRHVKLSRKQKAEAAKLIVAVQQNWSSMKTASVALLQNEFFQRPGKLLLKGSLVVTVERKTQDILLDKLSWGLTYIKLPWQDQFISANW